jgi:F0F1-type ATP synthase membrane subunit b/b'
MFALFHFFIFFAAETGHGASAGTSDFYNTYFNYPGFEAWKFINLFIFVGALVYLLRRPLSDAFKSKREQIRQELIRAQQERDAALAKLEEVNARLSSLETESNTIRAQAEAEARAEATRIAQQTNLDIEKMRENARREIEAASAQARRELKRFSANESVRLAEEILRRNLQTDDAARLVNISINGLSGNNGGAQ